MTLQMDFVVVSRRVCWCTSIRQTMFLMMTLIGSTYETTWNWLRWRTGVADSLFQSPLLLHFHTHRSSVSVMHCFCGGSFIYIVPPHMLPQWLWRHRQGQRTA